MPSANSREKKTKQKRLIIETIAIIIIMIKTIILIIIREINRN